jgi:hypothetical protein
VGDGNLLVRDVFGAQMEKIIECLIDKLEPTPNWGERFGL